MTEAISNEGFVWTAEDAVQNEELHTWIFRNCVRYEHDFIGDFWRIWMPVGYESPKG